MSCRRLLVDELRGSPRRAKGSEISIEHFPIALRHEIIRQWIARCRGKGEEKNHIDPNTGHGTIEVFLECAKRVINIQWSPTEKELDD